HILIVAIRSAYRTDPRLDRWGALEKDSAEFVGVWLLAPSLYDPGYIELGYRLHLKFWGQGLASEIAKALVHHGLNVLKLKEIAAVVHPENIASRKVLTKAGFQAQGEVFWYNEYLPFYKAVPPVTPP